jgi:hypothetical protein
VELKYRPRCRLQAPSSAPGAAARTTRGRRWTGTRPSAAARPPACPAPNDEGGAVILDRHRLPSIEISRSWDSLYRAAWSDTRPGYHGSLRVRERHPRPGAKVAGWNAAPAVGEEWLVMGCEFILMCRVSSLAILPTNQTGGVNSRRWLRLPRPGVAVVRLQACGDPERPALHRGGRRPARRQGAPHL